MKSAIVALALVFAAGCADVQVSPQYKAGWTPAPSVIGPGGPADDPTFQVPEGSKQREDFKRDSHSPR